MQLLHRYAAFLWPEVEGTCNRAGDQPWHCRLHDANQTTRKAACQHSHAARTSKDAALPCTQTFTAQAKGAGMLQVVPFPPCKP